MIAELPYLPAHDALCLLLLVAALTGQLAKAFANKSFRFSSGLHLPLSKSFGFSCAGIDRKEYPANLLL
jgi:hypothetical protein